MLGGEFATYMAIVLDGKVRADDGKEYKAGTLVGWEGLFTDNYHRQLKCFGGVQGGTIGIFLYSELARAELFDAECMQVRPPASSSLPCHLTLPPHLTTSPHLTSPHPTPPYLTSPLPIR